MRRISLVRLLAAVLALTLFVHSAFAENPDVYVPDSLKPWVGWVTERHPDLNCAVIASGKSCLWPGKLVLALEKNGGKFDYAVSTDREVHVQLPGGEKIWPLDVTVSSAGQKLPGQVLSDKNRPYLKLKTGKYSITGAFRWKAMPESILVPTSSALVDLQLEGKASESIKIGSGGELFLRKLSDGDTEELSSLDVEVQRKVVDGLPFRVMTRLQLRISGTAREIKLGNVLLDGTTPINVTSPLSYSLSSTYELTIQARPGVYNLFIDAVVASPPAELHPVKSVNDDWPGEEIWVWEANERLRSVELSGPPPIDSSRVSLLPDWLGKPSYILETNSKLEFKELRRGQTDSAPNQVNLSRQAWLDLDGTGFIFRDSLNGTMNQGWRLNSLQGTQLARLSVNGVDQLITKDPASELSGVEVVSQNISVSAESRIEAARTELPAVGWDFDVQSLNFVLSLPPGWTLLEAVGVDDAGGTWLSSWDLFEFFFVILVAVTAAKLLGLTWGLVSLVTLVLIHDQPNAPFMSWIQLLVCAALLRVVPEGKIRTGVKVYSHLLAFFVALMLIPYSIGQFRVGLFPQLGSPSHYGAGYSQGSEFLGGAYYDSGLFYSSFSTMIGLFQGVVGVIALAVIGIWFLVALFKKQFKFAGKLLLLGLGVAALQVIFSIFFSEMGFYNRSYNTYQAAQSGGVAAPQSEMMQNFDQPAVDAVQEFEAEDTSVLRSEVAKSAGLRGREIRAKRPKKHVNYGNLQMNEKNAVVQTGVGIPTWNWNSWKFSWDGPVRKDHTINLYLLSPRMNLVLALLRVGFLFALLYAFIDKTAWLGFARRVSFVAVIVCAAMLLPRIAHAQSYPDSELLSELENRILKDRCTGNCTKSSELTIQVQGEAISLRALVSSDGPGAWPIPGPVDQFLPTSVRIDGVETISIRRDEGGLLWVRVPDGSHELNISGRLLRANTVTLQFGINPGFVSVDAPQWSIDGLTDTGSVDSSLQLIRKAGERSAPKQAEISEQTQEILLPQWFNLKRDIQVGLKWTVTNTVERLGNSERALLARFPMMPGESITTDQVKVEGGEAIVAFPRGERTVSWQSDLEQKPELELTAGSGKSITENWTLACVSIYRCTISGIPPQGTIEDGNHLFSFSPWPGDVTKVKIEKPLGIEGRSTTLDKVTLDFAPGAELISATLTLECRSSQGGRERIYLPPNSNVLSVLVDGAVREIRPAENVLELPLGTGKQTFQIKWENPWSPGLYQRVPEVKLSSPAANVITSIRTPQRRVLLFAGGPQWGPAILIWGHLLVLLLIAILLGRSKITPLSTLQWILLGIGLILLPAQSIAIPIFWFVLLRLRERKPFENPGFFNLAQVFLGILTVMTLGIFFDVVQNGLLLDPDMQVRGFNSTNRLLRWYVDQTVDLLPTPWTISLPMWIYRAIMLAWSSWLVFSLLRWLRWAWTAFSSQGLWKGKAA